MRYFLEDIHNDLGIFRKLLDDEGWEFDPFGPEVLFLGHAGTPYHHRMIDAHPNAVVIVLDHGAPFSVTYDGIWTMHDRVAAYFAASEGSKNSLIKQELDVPIEVIGWHLTEILPFRKIPITDVRRITFAPIHPLPRGNWLHPKHAEANVNAQDWLLRTLKYTTAEIACRYKGTIEQNGLIGNDRMKWLSPYTPQNEVIGKSDIVVSYNRTFLAKAVALGCPAVAYAQSYPWFESWDEYDYREPTRWNWYKDDVYYPYDIEDHGAFALPVACNSQPVGWKEAFIGNEITTSSLFNAIQRTLDRTL